MQHRHSADTVRLRNPAPRQSFVCQPREGIVNGSILWGAQISELDSLNPRISSKRGNKTHTISGRGMPQPDGHQFDDQTAVHIGKDEKNATLNFVRRDAELRRTAIEQERLNAAICRDDTVESPATACVIIGQRIVRRRPIWHEAQAHLMIGSSRD